MIKCINFWEGRHQISREEATWNFGWFVILEHEVLDWVLSLAGMRIISGQTPIRHQSLGNFLLILSTNWIVIEIGWISDLPIAVPNALLAPHRGYVNSHERRQESLRNSERLSDELELFDCEFVKRERIMILIPVLDDCEGVFTGDVPVVPKRLSIRFSKE